MNNFTLLVLLLIGIGVFIFGPLITIWSLNTIFSLSIAYELETWFATVWLLMVTFGSLASTIKTKK
jgi:hypothetical protein